MRRLLPEEPTESPLLFRLFQVYAKALAVSCHWMGARSVYAQDSDWWNVIPDLRYSVGISGFTAGRCAWARRMERQAFNTLSHNSSAKPTMKNSNNIRLIYSPHSGCAKWLPEETRVKLKLNSLYPSKHRRKYYGGEIVHFNDSLTFLLGSRQENPESSAKHSRNTLPKTRCGFFSSGVWNQSRVGYTTQWSCQWR